MSFEDFSGIVWTVSWLLLFLLTVEYHVLRDYRLKRKLLYPLAVIKLIMGYLFSKFPGDFVQYVYDIQRGNSEHLTFGTDFIPYFNSFLQVFGFENYYYYFHPTMYMSFLGIIYLYKSIITINPNTNNSKWLNVFMFLPGLSFWTAGIGKDGIVFLGITMFIYHYLKTNRLFGLFQVIGLLLILFPRPHIFIIILISYFLSLIFSSDVDKLKRVIYGIIAVVIFVTAIPLISMVIQVDITDLAAISEKTAKNSTYRQDATSYVNISSYPVILKMFTYLFRPFPLEVRTVAFTFFGLENLILLVLLFPLFSYKYWKQAFKRQKVLFFLITGIIIPFVLSFGMGNFGVFLRQKWMAIPFLVLFVSASLKTKSILTKKQNINA